MLRLRIKGALGSNKKYRAEARLKVAGHPVRFAVCLHVEIEWEIAMWICPYHQDLWQKIDIV